MKPDRFVFLGYVSRVADQQVVFEQTIEGLFIRALGRRLTPSMIARLKTVGLDLEKKLLPAYAFTTWMMTLRVAAEELYPGHSLDDALFKVGELMITGYQETFMGRAVLGMIRVIGPKRTLLRSTRAFRSGNNYTEARVTEVGPSCMDVWMNEVGPYPSFTAGIMHGAMVAAGARSAKVEMSGHDGHACSYRVSWA